MHLVGPLFHPLEETIDAVPLVILPEFLAGKIGSFLPSDHETLIGLGQLLEGKMHIDVSGGTGPQQVTLALARLTALERFHHAAGDAQGSIRHDPIVIDADHAAESPTVGAGAERIIETEETCNRRPDIEIAMGAVPTR